MKIGVTGYNGRLGTEFVNHGYDPVFADISDPKQVKEQSGMFDVIINCAAFTNVDLCEDLSKQEDVVNSNFIGPRNLVTLLPNTKIIHISTDYVFGGKNGPYKESYIQKDGDEPVNFYGLSKLTAERALMVFDNAYIIRTTGLYGRSAYPEHHDFVRLVRHNLEHEEKITISKNLYGNQTYIPHLIDGIEKYLSALEYGNMDKIIHIASRDVISRYEFALMIASVFNLDKQLVIPVNSISIPGWKAKRPVNGGLNTNYAEKMGIPIYSILDGLQELYDETCYYNSVL